jgi:hypothetical protein
MLAPAPAAVVVRLDDLGVVSTTINGDGPYHFALDTGAGITVLTPEFAQRARITGAGSGKATGSGGTVQVQQLVLHSVALGRATVYNVAAAIIPLPLDFTYQGDYGTIDGVLGYSFLSHFAVTIDMQHHRLTLTSPTAYRTPAGAASEAADLSDNTPVVQARADDIAGSFKLDTGDSSSLTLTSAFVAAHGFARRYPSGVPELFEGVGGFQHARAVRVANFTLGGATLHDVTTSLSFARTGVLAGTTLAGNVGDAILRCFVFTVDYARKRVDFTPNELLGVYVPYKSIGALATRQADGAQRVIVVEPNTAAARAGLKVGDTVVAINGYPIARLDWAQIREALAADTVTYTIRSGSRERDVTFGLTDQLPQR